MTCQRCTWCFVLGSSGIGSYENGWILHKRRSTVYTKSKLEKKLNKTNKKNKKYKVENSFKKEQMYEVGQIFHLFFCGCRAEYSLSSKWCWGWSGFPWWITFDFLYTTATVIWMTFASADGGNQIMYWFKLNSDWTTSICIYLFSAYCQK